MMKQLWSEESGAPFCDESGVSAARLQTRAQSRYPGSAGFTLIELMIVVAIIAVLTAIAYPAYTSYITKTHRVAAEGCLSEYSNYMERYYTTHMRYDRDGPASTSTANTTARAGLDCDTQTKSYYGYAFPAPLSSSLAPAAYKIAATPVGAQQKNDTKCAILTIDQTGNRTVSGTGTVAQCW